MQKHEDELRRYLKSYHIAIGPTSTWDPENGWVTIHHPDEGILKPVLQSDGKP